MEQGKNDLSLSKLKFIINHKRMQFEQDTCRAFNKSKVTVKM